MAQKQNLLTVQITGAHQSEDYIKMAGNRHSPEMVAWESPIRAKTACLLRCILKPSLPPSSALGCQAGPQPRTGSNLAQVPPQSWDPISDTEPSVIFSKAPRPSVCFIQLHYIPDWFLGDKSKIQGIPLLPNYLNSPRYITITYFHLLPLWNEG